MDLDKSCLPLFDFLVIFYLIVISYLICIYFIYFLFILFHFILYCVHFVLYSKIYFILLFLFCALCSFISGTRLSVCILIFSREMF